MEYLNETAIVVRRDLNMRKGKMIAQGAHASMAAILDYKHEVMDNDYIKQWLNNSFTKICVSVNSEKELLDIFNAANLLDNLPCALIKDNGTTEFGGVKTYTAIAIGPGPIDLIDKITGDLKLL